MYSSSRKKKALYLNVNVFSTQVLIGDTIFTSPYWRRDRLIRWSSEPREGLAIRRAKAVPSFLSHFKTSRSSVKRSTNWANALDFEEKQQQQLLDHT